MKLSRIVSSCALACSLVASAWGQGSAAQGFSVYAEQDGYVDANGVLLYYVAMGHGKPLVILHGGPGQSHDYLLPYLLPLMRENRLIFMDERGSGKSERLDETPEKYTVEAMADDVEAVRKSLGL